MAKSINSPSAKLSKIKGKNGIYLLVSKPENYSQDKINLLLHLTKKLNCKGVCVLLNSSYAVVTGQLKNKGVDVSTLFFIDCTGQKVDKAGISNCIFVQSPGSLTELSLAVTTVLNSGKIKWDFVVVDSINTFLVHNALQMCQRFLQFLMGKLRAYGVNGNFFVFEEVNAKPLINVVSTFVDETLFL